MHIVNTIYAQANNWSNLSLDSGYLFGQGPGTTWGGILNVITNMIFVVAGIIAFFYLIYSGFIYLTAGGNPDSAKKGQQGLLNAILGLIIIFLAYGIVRFLTSFLNSRAG